MTNNNQEFQVQESSNIGDLQKWSRVYWQPTTPQSVPGMFVALSQQMLTYFYRFMLVMSSCFGVLGLLLDCDEISMVDSGQRQSFWPLPIPLMADNPLPLLPNPSASPGWFFYFGIFYSGGHFAIKLPRPINQQKKRINQQNVGTHWGFYWVGQVRGRPSWWVGTSPFFKLVVSLSAEFPTKGLKLICNRSHSRSVLISPPYLMRNHQLLMLKLMVAY